MLMPRGFPRLPGLQGAVHYEPSQRLSGDFYDFHDVGRGRLAVLIADVSGHGVSAALYTGMVKSEMLAVRDEPDHLDMLFASINERLGVSVRRRYVTALLVLLDVKRRRARYVNAGHPSFFTADGRTWESTGPPLGMLAGAAYEVREVALQPDDRLLLYTDGLSEAMRDDGDEFGVERVREAFLAARAQPPQAAVEAVVAAARRWSQHDAFEDDATAVVLQLGG
jgi:sigma-B regulation protein RsbU (phosphoserine phosphatase)